MLGRSKGIAFGLMAIGGAVLALFVNATSSTPATSLPASSTYYQLDSGIPYATALANFHAYQTSQLTNEYASAYPKPCTVTPCAKTGYTLTLAGFWGTVNQNIAAAALLNAGITSVTYGSHTYSVYIDSSETGAGYRALASEMAACKSSSAAQHGFMLGASGCSDLVWPMMMRMYFLANQVNETAGKPDLITGAYKSLLLSFFKFIVDTGISQPVDGSFAQSNYSNLAHTPLQSWASDEGSENHHYCFHSTYLLASLALAKNRNPILADGQTTALSYYGQWLAHWHYLLDERVRHGLFIESRPSATQNILSVHS